MASPRLNALRRAHLRGSAAAEPATTAVVRAGRRSNRTRLVAGAIAVGLAAGAAPTASAGANEPRLDTRERAVIHRINNLRADHGLPRLAFGGKLSRAADRHSRRLLRSQQLTHQLPGEATLQGRLAHAARARPLGEVIYRHRRSAGSAQIVRAWARSPSHRALLLRRDFGRAGIGIRTGRAGLYVTLDFAAD